MTNAELINAGLITELAGVLPTHELASMMQRFAEDLVAKHAQLEDALQKHDCEAICKAAHAMTGTCGTFGAMRLSEECRELLEICEAHHISNNGKPDMSCAADMQARVKHINHCIEETLKALEKALLDQGS